MKSYFFNPNGDLVIHDSEDDSLLILNRVEKVRVFTGGDIRLGDFEDKGGEAGRRGGEKTRDSDGRIVGKRGKKTRRCKRCGEAGHRSDTCPQKGEE